MCIRDRRSTFIVGFPGETDADFAQLLEFLAAAELDRVGCFAYSPVDGAPANALADPVPETVKQERQGRLMELQASISARRLQGKIGRTLTVLVDANDEGGAIARSSADAPEIDGVVSVSYTHLDVYKRQRQCCACSRRRRSRAVWRSAGGQSPCGVRGRGY